MYKKKDNILYFFGAACRWMSLALPDRFSVVRQERFWESIAFMFRNDTFCQIFSVKSISYVKKNLSFFCDITCASILVIGKCQKVTFFTSSELDNSHIHCSVETSVFSVNHFTWNQLYVGMIEVQKLPYFLVTHYLVKQLLSWNFCQKCVRENYRNFHTV